MSLEKIAQYKDEIEKVASRAWKRNLGKIGEKGIEKLVDSGVLNRKKELKGLRRGTHNILRKENAKMLRKPEHFAGIGTRSSKNMYEKAGVKLDAEDIAAMKDSIKNMGPAGMPDLNIEGVKYKGVAHVRKGAGKRVNKMVNEQSEMLNDMLPDDKKIKKLKNIPRKDRESKKWQQAILERHEADEVRFGNKVMKSKKHTMDMNGMKQPTTNFASHLTPKVLVAESSHAALAPKNAKNSMKNLRSFNENFIGHENTEMGALKNYAGGKFEYGANAVYDKKAGKKAENFISRTRKGIK